MSYVALRLTVTSRPPDQSCAYRADFSAGVLSNPEAPRRCAGNPGTFIEVEELFHNIPSRREALRSSKEEFTRVADVVARSEICLLVNACGYSLICLIPFGI